MLDEGGYMAKRGIGHVESDKPVLIEERGDAVFNKTIRGIPSKLKKDFEQLKKQGKVHGSLNSYMVYSLAQQIERDS